ncbi:integrase, partial [Variovorax sp. LG9.2]|nr:integrase [Variovorax sp. LG9.2]
MKERNSRLDLTRRAYAKRSALATKQTALTADLLAQLLATCDRALLTLAWATGGRRRSEVEGATLENLQPTGASFVYRLGHSKSNQLGQDLPENYKPLVGSAA